MFHAANRADDKRATDLPAIGNPQPLLDKKGKTFRQIVRVDVIPARGENDVFLPFGQIVAIFLIRSLVVTSFIRFER